jgi:hypothetical protein
MSKKTNTARQSGAAKAEPTAIDLTDLARLGEIWHRPAGFDHVGWAVVSYWVLTADRRYSLVTYNGTLGRRGRTVAQAMGAGYPLADREAERRKLERRGYTLASPAPEAPKSRRGRPRKGIGR